LCEEEFKSETSPASAVFSSLVPRISNSPHTEIIIVNFVLIIHIIRLLNEFSLFSSCPNLGCIHLPGYFYPAKPSIYPATRKTSHLPENRQPIRSLYPAFKKRLETFKLPGHSIRLSKNTRPFYPAFKKYPAILSGL